MKFEYTYKIDYEFNRKNKIFCYCKCINCESFKIIRKDIFLNNSYMPCSCSRNSKYIVKAKWAKKNDYNLLRISYTQIEDIDKILNSILRNNE